METHPPLEVWQRSPTSVVVRASPKVRGTTTATMTTRPPARERVRKIRVALVSRICQSDPRLGPAEPQPPQLPAPEAEEKEEEEVAVVGRDVDVLLTYRPRSPVIARFDGAKA